MARADEHILVVGAGLAGLRTVAELRSNGWPGAITLIGGESHPPYDRPPLSKELLSHPDPVWLSEDLGHDLADANTVSLGHRAVSLHVRASGFEVEMDDGGTYVGDQVVVATGSRPIVPAHWQGVTTLHTLDEANALRTRLLEAAPGLEVVVIGAGWIGAEIAGVAASTGAHVRVIEAGPTPLWRQLGPELGAHTVPWYGEAGVELMCERAVGAVIDRPERAGDGQGRYEVTLSDGEVLAADVVLCAVGARPDTEWLSGAVELGERGHLHVDAAGRSSLRGLWAVGDAAEREHPLFGTTPGGHWSAALYDPAALAREVMGLAPAEAEPAPYLTSIQLGHQVAVYGRLSQDRLLRGTPGEGGWASLSFTGDGLCGAVIFDAPRDVAAVRKLLGKGYLPRLDRELASRPGVRLTKALAVDPAGA